MTNAINIQESDTGQHMQRIIEESVSLLREMIAIPSPSFHEEEVSLHISSFLDRHEIRHIRTANNIVALNRNFSPDRKTLMLCAHIDTVEPCSGYGFDPYAPDIRTAANAIYGEDAEAPASPRCVQIIPGLGANDDGASAVSMIAAFRFLYMAELPFNIMLVLSAEEERSGATGMQLVWEKLEEGMLFNETCGTQGQSRRVKAGIPDYAIVGEPTGMKAAIAERGLLVIDACAEGVSGHAARGEGVNALYVAMDDIMKLRDFRFCRTSPLMGSVRLSVTQIQAGTAHNVIPDRCSFVIDIRPTEQYTNKEILDILQAECRSSLKARNLKNRSSATAGGSPLARCAEASGIGTFVSPTTSDWMRIGCDAIKMGPGDSSRSHRKNEYVTVQEITDGVKTYIQFIQNLGQYIQADR